MKQPAKKAPARKRAAPTTKPTKATARKAATTRKKPALRATAPAKKSPTARKTPAKRAPAKRAPTNRPAATSNPKPATTSPPPSLANRKRTLASNLLDDAERLRTQMFAPTITHKVVTVGEGEGRSSAEVVEVNLEEPTFADKKLIVTSISVIVERLAALDSGREAKGTVRDELEQRRKDRRSNTKTAAATSSSG